MSAKTIKIQFVTGKGGVGKSTVAAAMALGLSQKGQNVLLVELGDYSRFSGLFGVPDLGQKPVKIQSNLSVAMWSGAACLKEYALHLLKIETLYRLFFENQVSRTLINIAPGLKEIAVTGKITSGPPRNVGPALHYDQLVIDAFSTGHFLSLLKAPSAMAQAVSFGPMGEQSRSIDKVLRDPQICQYHVVMIPEELPVVEGLELASGIQTKVGFRPQLILNKVYPQDSAPELSSDFRSELLRQNEQASEARKRVNGELLRELPFVFETDARKAVEKFSGSFT